LEGKYIIALVLFLANKWICNIHTILRREGKLLQSRVIRDRLYKELDRNVALKVYETDNSDTYEVPLVSYEANTFLFKEYYSSNTIFSVV
jgi:hypothetical protein